MNVLMYGDHSAAVWQLRSKKEVARGMRLLLRKGRIISISVPSSLNILHPRFAWFARVLDKACGNCWFVNETIVIGLSRA